MLGYAILALEILVFLTVYGLMAGFTVQLARRVGYKDENAYVAGFGWPIGLGLVITYGLSHSVGVSKKERTRVHNISAAEQRSEEMEVQVHATKIAELKAKESLALEKAISPTYKAKEIE